MDANYQKHVKEFADKHVKFIVDPSKVLSILKKFKDQVDFVIYDTETTGLDPFSEVTHRFFEDKTKEPEEFVGARVFSMQLGIYDEKTNNLHCMFIRFEDNAPWDYAKTNYIENVSIMKVGHNIKFDEQVSIATGIKFNGPIWDTLTATRFTHDRERSHGLKYLGNLFSGNYGADEDKWETEIKNFLCRAKSTHTRKGFSKNYVNYSYIPKAMIEEYALKDIWYTYLIFQIELNEIEENYSELFAVEMDNIKLLAKMERRGVKIDRKRCIAAEKEYWHYNEESLKSLLSIAKKYKVHNFKPGSHLQVKSLLTQMKVPKYLLTKKGKITSDAETLRKVLSQEQLISEDTKNFIRLLFSFRASAKLAGTYFGPIHAALNPKDILHCSFKPSDTATGRSACVNPNLQNIPRIETLPDPNLPTVRSIFIPRAGYHNLYFDYSQVEMRVFAIFAQSKKLLDHIREGLDLHSATALMVFGSDEKAFRQKAKAINFGKIYGMGINTLAETLKVSLIEARKLDNLYNKKIPGIVELTQRAKRELNKKGYAEDMFGRRYHVPIEKSYIVVNSLVQGGSANVLKHAAIQVSRLISQMKHDKLIKSGDIHPLLVIHDEESFEIKKDVCEFIAPYIKVTMEEIEAIRQFNLETTVDIEMSTRNWEEKKEFNCDKKSIDKARKYILSHRKRIIFPRPSRRIDWFMR